METVVQTSFVGGEWSPLAQGQVDNPNYHKSLALCSNAIPLEEGAWVRRSGTLHGGYTNRGLYAKSFQFPFGADSPYAIEISTDGSNSWMTFWRNGQRVTDSTLTLDNSNAPTGSPATFTTTANLSTTGWVTGDDITILGAGTVPWPVTNNSLNGATLLNRTFTITGTGAKTFTMVDAVTGVAVNAADFTYDNTVTNKLSRVTKNTCPYVSVNDVSITRAVCVYDGTATNNVEIVLLNQGYAPIIVAGFYESPGNAGFTKSTAAFTDGPYVLQEGGTMTLGGASGTVSFTHAGNKINNGAGFASADIGRTMRVLTEPPAWASGTAYSAGSTVSYPTGFAYATGAQPQPMEYFSAVVANTGVDPTTTTTVWVPYEFGQQWTWGTIATVTNSTTGTYTIVGPAIPNYANCTYWQMDYFSWFWGWPYAGCFTDGRLWLTSVTGTEGRFDASAAGQSNYFIFSPTDQYGDVGDGNAISYTIVDPIPSNIVWLAADAAGIVAGREHDEWTIRPSSAGTAMSPTNVEARRATGFGSGFLTDPLRIGAALTMIDRTYGRAIELVTNMFSGKLTGRNMSKLARHLGRGLFRRMCFQDSTVPSIWLNDFANKLYGCVYRRIGFNDSSDPDLLGWHKHSLGSAWAITDIISTSSYSSNATLDQTGDAVYLTTYDGTYYHMEIMQPIFDTEALPINGWFLDSAPAYVIGRDPALDSSTAEIQIYGLKHLAGKVVTAFIMGLDCGTATVSAGGVLTIAYGADPEGKLTAANLIAASGTYTYGCPIDVKSGGSRHQVTVPVVVGFKYLSEGQMLRPANPPDVMQAKGTGLAKKRRLVQYGALLNATGSCNFGSSSGNTIPAALGTFPTGALTAASGTFSGVHWDAAPDTASFEGMLYWSSNSCYPMQVVTATAFLDTGER